MLAVRVAAEPAKELINVDLPTLGMPKMMVRIERLRIPFATQRSMIGLLRRSTVDTNFLLPLPDLESMANTVMPCCVKNSVHSFVAFGSAKSTLFNSTICGF